MFRTETLHTAVVGTRSWNQVRAAVRWLRPPTNTVRFWVVQGGVVGVAILHDLLFDDLHGVLPLGYPTSLTATLLLIPIIYAALNFGVRGSVATALWASVLMAPDIAVLHANNRQQAWIETSILIVVNAVAIVVGQRAEQERHARRRTEEALYASERSELRYRTLFEEQHAPILIADETGTVVEANTAATGVFVAPVGANLSALLPTVRLSGESPDENPVELKDRSGVLRWFLPTVRVLPLAPGGTTAQIVLTDVTAEQRHQDEQRAYAAHLIAVQEEERRRLARDLHDDPLQTLMFLVRSLNGLTAHPNLPAEMITELQHDGALAEQTTHALREIIRGLRPPILDDLGLVSALGYLATEALIRCGLLVEVHVHGTPTRLAPETELALYRITQEALTNTVRHAQAHRVDVHLRFAFTLTLTITDDGIGPPINPLVGRPNGGLGILGMRERLTHLGGTLTIHGGACGGTVVEASVPSVGREDAIHQVDGATECWTLL